MFSGQACFVYGRNGPTGHKLLNSVNRAKIPKIRNSNYLSILSVELTMADPWNAKAGSCLPLRGTQT